MHTVETCGAQISGSVSFTGVGGGSHVALVVKKLPTSAGDIRDLGLIPGLAISPGGRHGNPLQYSCLENPIDRGAWRAKSIGLQRVGHE